MSDVETEVHRRGDGLEGRDDTLDIDESGDAYDTSLRQDTQPGLVGRRASMSPMSPRENTDTVLIEYDMVFRKDVWDRMQVKEKLIRSISFFIWLYAKKDHFDFRPIGKLRTEIWQGINCKETFQIFLQKTQIAMGQEFFPD